MDSSFHRFQVGDFECIRISDGTKDYVPKYFFNSVTEANIQRALRGKLTNRQDHKPLHTSSYRHRGTLCISRYGCG